MQLLSSTFVSAKTSVALTGRNRTTPQGSVGCRTTHVPSRRPSTAAFPQAQQQAGLHTGSVTDDDDRRQHAKQYWPIRQASSTA